MPGIQKVFFLEITPEKFIDNCSDIELQEVWLLANSRLNRTQKTDDISPTEEPQTKKRSPWTSNDDQLIRQLYSTKETAKIAEQLGRSVHSVEVRASNLGLKKAKMTFKELSTPKRIGRSKKDGATTVEEERELHATAIETANTFSKQAEAGKVPVRVNKRTIVYTSPKNVEKIKKKFTNK